MSSPMPVSKPQVASISDRGLNEKRPVNEDSFLADSERGIFAVADGVGGAEAGEVASQTAIEVLSEAFRHRLGDRDDAEDLMELAIQRANSSIHRMATEQPRFSMMATTIVALHLDRDKATFGHVGDSRLYRLTPDGTLRRETEDHSIVEEEVRAGRMTREQAANHPSKNVISRALGAEDSVEVDMKTIEFDEGTTFLLCTDGITRHIPDNELRGLLLSGQSVEAVCSEIKQRCYQRGAEDNLTAVIVQVGTPRYSAATIDDDERTAPSARVEARPTAPGITPPAGPTHLMPPSRIAFPGPIASQQSAGTSATSKSGSAFGRAVRRLFVFLLFVAVVAAAFYGGIIFHSYYPSPSPPNILTPQPRPVSQQAERAAEFDRKRAAVDNDPQKWLAAAEEAGGTKPADSKDPELLYLYGRALMLTGKHREAMRAFELALENLRTEGKANLPLDTELKLADAAAALKLKSQSGGVRSQEALLAEQKATRVLDEMLGVKSNAPAK